MSISQVRSVSLAIPSAIGWTVCSSGALGIFATYWDESWHTDIGRDSFWMPAHMLLYAAMAVVGLGIAGWGLRVLAVGSIRCLATYLPVVAAMLGALSALAAAPIDAAWHSAFGRDAVEWSPPHMLVVFAAVAIGLGVLGGLDPSAQALRVGAGVIVLADAVAVVFEYETDVPQFSETIYLPILLAVGLLVAWIVRETVPVPWPVTTVVLGYAALRLAITGALAIMDRSTPDLPIAVLGLAAYDLPLCRRWQRPAAAALTTASAAWLASGTGLASPDPRAVGLTAAPIIVVSLLVLLGAQRWAPALLPLTALLFAVAGGIEATAQRADAHDPGEGTAVAVITMTATTDRRGTITVQAHLMGPCRNVGAQSLVARRAGVTIAAPLLRMQRACTYSGRLKVTEPGRWFTYVGLTFAGQPVEAWLPVQTSSRTTVTERRSLYRPVGTTTDNRATEIGVGVPIYLAGVTLAGIGITAVRRSTPRPQPDVADVGGR